MFLVLKPHGGAPTGCIGNDKPVPEPEPPWDARLSMLRPCQLIHRSSTKI